MGGFTLVSRFLGLVRDVLMAGQFGASLAMSAFVVAFTVPNLFRRLFGEGALSAAFIPVFVETRKREGEAAAWLLAKRVISLVGLTLLCIVILGGLLIALCMARPDWIAAVSDAVGRPELAERVALILPLLRIMLPYMFFICLAALSMAILNSYHHFWLPAFTPAVLNVVWIAAVLIVCPLLGPDPVSRVYGVAWAVLAAGVLQLAVQVPMLMRYGFRPGLAGGWREERVARVFRLMGPAALGLAVTQFNVVIDRLLAAWISESAPAALFYSERLIYFPLGIFATALGTVLLPVFSGHAAEQQADKTRAGIQHGLRMLLFIMVPAAAGLLVLAGPIVRMIFEWGQFTAANTDYTRIALQCYAPGLIVFSLAKVLVPAFYAGQDTRTPVKIGVLCMLLNLVLNVAFILTWPQPIKHAGLACATVISEGVYAIILAVLIHRRLGSPGWGRIGIGLLKASVSATCMALLVAAASRLLPGWLGDLPLPAKVVQILSVCGALALGVVAYLVAAWILRARELRELLGVLKRRRA